MADDHTTESPTGEPSIAPMVPSPGGMSPLFRPAPLQQPGPRPGHLAPPPPDDAAPHPTNSLAQLALMCSLGGLITGVTAIAGVICGHLALRQIRRTGERGRGQAIGGIALGYAVVVVVVVAWSRTG
jgi:hypothetical protein